MRSLRSWTQGWREGAACASITFPNGRWPPAGKVCSCQSVRKEGQMSTVRLCLILHE